jgi:hypothetical protein
MNEVMKHPIPHEQNVIADSQRQKPNGLSSHALVKKQGELQNASKKHK